MRRSTSLYRYDLRGVEGRDAPAQLVRNRHNTLRPPADGTLAVPFTRDHSFVSYHFKQGSPSSGGENENPHQTPHSIEAVWQLLQR